jgi:toxin YhaV
VKANGWTLLSHAAINGQLDKLTASVARARAADPEGYLAKVESKLLSALAKLMLEDIPTDPGHRKYRLGRTFSQGYRHWRRAKFSGSRFRLFFRYDSEYHIIVYAWVNDRDSLRKAGDKNDPYAKFGRMLASGNPPNDWDSLVKACAPLPKITVFDELGPSSPPPAPRQGPIH